MNNLIEKIKQLPPELQEEVRKVMRFLLEKKRRKPSRKPNFKWAEALRDLKDQYTPVKLQHKSPGGEWKKNEVAHKHKYSLEMLLGQADAVAARHLLADSETHEFFITDSAEHSIGLLLFRKDNHRVFQEFTDDMLLNGYLNIKKLAPDNSTKSAIFPGSITWTLTLLTNTPLPKSTTSPWSASTATLTAPPADTKPRRI
ncbi:MAG: hypothetical protein Kow0037_27230 [Calditrichia bacterium]